MINLKRMLNLFNFDFVHNKKYYLLLAMQTCGVVIVLYCFLRFFINFDRNELLSINVFIFSIFLVIFGLIFTVNSNKPINNTFENIFYFTLPVSNLERFILMLIKFLVLYPVFLLLIYFASLNLAILIDNSLFLIIKSPYLLFKENIHLKSFLNAYLTYFTLLPAFLIGSIVFKKNPLGKTTTIIIFCLISILISLTYISYFMINVFYGINIFNIKIEAPLRFENIKLYFYLLAAFLYPAYYFKLEEYELKN